MPSTSEKQARFMRAVSHSPKFAAAAGVPQSVGQDFEAADQAAGKYQGHPMMHENRRKLAMIIAGKK